MNDELKQKLNGRHRFIVFDWDGTLMDSTARIVSSMQSTARIAGFDKPTEKQVKSIIGLSMDAVITKIFPSASHDYHQTLKDIYREQYVEQDQTPSPLFSGTMETLDWIKSNDLTVAVATGKARAGLTRALDSVNLSNYFSLSICADEAESKPHPEMIDNLLKQTDFSKEETLLIGDSLHDLGMANNAGVDCIAVTTGANTYSELANLKPIGIIDRIQQLKSILI